MEYNYLVTVIIPAYNVERHIVKCLNSIKHQTYKNFEIIIINDASTDNTSKILEKNFAKTNVIKIVNNLKNIGPEGSRFIGVRKASGKFIMFVDADDLLSHTAIEILLRNIITKQSDLAIGKIRKFYFSPLILKKNTIIHNEDTTDKEEINKIFLNSFFFSNLQMMSLSGKMYKAEVLKNTIPLQLDFRWQEDACYNIQLLDNIRRISFLDENVYYYRYGGGSSSFDIQRLSQFVELFFFKTKIIKKFNSFQYEPRVYIEFQNFIYSLLANHIVFNSRDKNKFLECVKLIKEKENVMSILQNFDKFQIAIIHPFDKKTNRIIKYFLGNDSENLYLSMIKDYNKNKLLFFVKHSVRKIYSFLQ